MLKVVLVDDEDIIREGIFNGIDWNSLGFEVVGTAEDGEMALEVANQTKPDIIITDIKMPFLDGLQFIERVKPLLPKVNIIIISGHDEFNYAQKALKLGAYDYILKPIDLEYLQEILIKIKSQCMEEALSKLEIDALKERAEENEEFLRESFLKEIISNKRDLEYIKRKLKDYGVTLEGEYFAAVSVQIDDYIAITQDLSENEVIELELNIGNTINKIIVNEQNFISFQNKRGEYVIVAAHKNPEILKRKISDVYNTVREKYREEGKCTVTAGVGGVYDSLDMISLSYKEALDTINYMFIIGKDRIIFFDNVKTYEKNEYYSMDYNDVDLISLIKTGDKKAIEEKLHALMNDVKSRGSNSYLYMQIVISSIYMQAIRVLKEVGGSVEEVFSNPIDVYNRIMKHQTVENLMTELTSVLFSISDHVTTRKTSRFNLVIERAKEYIRKNYNRDDFSLEDVAKFVNMSVSYFSVIFKQEVGETFIDYLTGIRMEKAKELLALPAYKTYEISYMIGYNNPTYFSTMFKKYTGFSPSDYRDKSGLF